MRVVKALPYGFAVVVLDGDDVDLLDGVARAVDGHVEADVEQVLVVRGGQLRRHPGGVVAGDVAGDGEHDAGQLDVELDRAVLVQVPEEAVVVVADRRPRRHDEATRTADLAGAAEEVLVLPQHADVLLVQAHDLRQLDRLALVVGVDGVEVVDLAEAVAAERQRAGQAAEAVLALVEVADPEAHRVRVGVGHDHLGHRRSVHDRADPTAVGVAELVQHEALAGVEADAERPALPLDSGAVDLEAGPVRLGDGERPQARPHRTPLAFGEVGLAGRDRVATVVGEVEDAPLDRGRRRR